MITTMLGLMILLLVGCSNEEVPNHLVFEGKSENFNVHFEVSQSPHENKNGKYNYSERPVIEYIGEDYNYELGKRFSWKITGSDIIQSRASGTSKKRRFGVTPPGNWYESTAFDSYLKKDASLTFKMDWGQKNESIPLKLTKVSYTE